MSQTSHDKSMYNTREFTNWSAQLFYSANIKVVYSEWPVIPRSNCHRKCFVWTYTYLDSVGAAMDQIKISDKFMSFKSLCQYINTVRKFRQNLQYFPSYMLKQLHWLYVDKYHQELSSLKLCKHECLNTWIHTTLWTIVLIHHMKSIIHCVIKS